MAGPDVAMKATRPAWLLEASQHVDATVPVLHPHLVNSRMAPKQARNLGAADLSRVFVAIQ